jgi:hypothetical protein
VAAVSTRSLRRLFWVLYGIACVASILQTIYIIWLT